MVTVYSCKCKKFNSEFNLNKNILVFDDLQSFFEPLPEIDFDEFTAMFYKLIKV